MTTVMVQIKMVQEACVIYGRGLTHQQASERRPMQGNEAAATTRELINPLPYRILGFYVTR